MGEISGALSRRKTLVGHRRHEDDHDDLLLPAEHCFMADKIRILQSKGFRRLPDKAQVVTCPLNCHIRNRLSHTAEVAAISVMIAKVLGLNTGLSEAIAWGHDLGHVPFGHVGEKFIAEVTNRPFKHEVMSVVVCQHVERKGRGLNLTREVLNGIRQHSGALKVSDNMLPEARIVAYADKLAYLLSDYSDFERMEIHLPEELGRLMMSLGVTQRERIRQLTNALCVESAESGNVLFQDSEEAQCLRRIRELMYEIYPTVTEQNPKVRLARLYEFLSYAKLGDPALCISLMTDEEALFLSEQKMLNHMHFRSTSVGEIMPHLRDKKIDLCDADLDW
jgi:dGTPase